MDNEKAELRRSLTVRIDGRTLEVLAATAADQRRSRSNIVRMLLEDWSSGKLARIEERAGNE